MRVHVLPSALVIAATLLLVPSAFAAPPGPPENVTAIDRPDDAGSTIQLTWKPSTTTPADAQPVIQYLILRKTGDGEFEEIQAIAATESMFSDTGRKNGVEYFYSVIAVASDGSKSTPATTDTPAVASTQYFDGKRSWFLVILLLITCSIVYFINLARRGHELKIRKITGLEAVNEAVGRATEMGRSCLFIPGILDINDIQTVAGITVLSRVAGLAAEYDATLEVPTSRSLVMTTARETVEAAYLAAGRPDAYREDNIYYLTDEQFGYVAGVTGTMVREKPAACFYMGAFFAESLILAETGNSIGAIQVAGTAMPSQLPFFVAACDYTLIGEEFFAASAYLSGEKHQLGSLKGQDVGKVFGSLLLIVGCLLATFSLGSSKATFTRLDENRDGMISQSESPQMSEAEFTEIDQDKNNALDLEEISSFKSGTVAESLQSATDYITDNLLGSNGF
ncbi:MAG: DUF6754 domain-containing protein [Planctomycetota bacterium]|nr:DUF6754 domain-containing protein [Planctomycetota bacterium]